MDPLVMMGNVFDEYCNEFTAEYKGRIIKVLYTENGVDIQYRARLMKLVGFEFEVRLIKDRKFDKVDLSKIESKRFGDELEQLVRRLQVTYNRFRQYFKVFQAAAYSEETNIWYLVQLKDVLWSSDRPCEFLVENWYSKEEEIVLASNVRSKFQLCRELGCRQAIPDDEIINHLTNVHRRDLEYIYNQFEVGVYKRRRRPLHLYQPRRLLDIF
ncbi:uncharacterized protein LOC116340417 [Contarinia nasturtii]|uniref:uncharacterized protein LOC116340417 n=1 Tax=Contarinia nasturtii TaxID=265458 RepID=UPI0012D495F6|nr:uncharacterized protein LOC116340417 [Contarinia nasturtii]